MKHWDDINFVSVILWPVSILFRFLSGARRLLYKLGILQSWRVSVPVIVVGNISVGGTGKTPVVVALVEWLKLQGYKPGVISRGYGGADRALPLILQSDSKPIVVGDEPVLISRRTDVPVCVFPNRIQSAQHLLEHTDCDVLVADDGLQHYALQRDLEIIVIDAQKLHGNGFCLPAGPLREPECRIDTDAFALYNREQESDDGKSFTLKAGNFVALGNLTEQGTEAFAGREVLACVGTASPERFFRTLTALGLKLNTRVFADHHQFVAQDFKNTGNLPIVMTEKDAVKCTEFGLKNAWYLPVETQLPDQLFTRVAEMLSKPTADKQN